MQKILIVIAAGLLTGFVLMKFTSKPNTPKFSSVTPSPKAQSYDSTPPVDVNNPDVQFFGMSYTFGGVVRKIEGEGSEYKIEIKNTIKSMPDLVTNENTTVIKREDGIDSPANLVDIKSGDRVSIATLYDAKLKKWRVNRIFIIIRPLFKPQPTSSS